MIERAVGDGGWGREEDESGMYKSLLLDLKWKEGG